MFSLYPYASMVLIYVDAIILEGGLLLFVI